MHDQKRPFRDRKGQQDLKLNTDKLKKPHYPSISVWGLRLFLTKLISEYEVQYHQCSQCPCGPFGKASLF